MDQPNTDPNADLLAGILDEAFFFATRGTRGAVQSRLPAQNKGEKAGRQLEELSE